MSEPDEGLIVEIARALYPDRHLMSGAYACAEPAADAILASDWLAKREADILAPIRAILDDYSDDPRTNLAAAVCERLRAVIDTPAQADGDERV